MNVPKLRFKEFDGEWETCKLGSVTNSFSGGTPSVGNSSYYNGDVPFIRSGEINSEKTELFLTEEGLNNSSAKIVEVGDILYALYGATSGEVSISKIHGAINQAILAIKPIKGYSSQFIMQWLKLQKKKVIGKYLQGGQGNLSGSIVKDLLVKFPNFEEQQKNGEFFEKLDKKIQLQQQKIDLLQEQKKGYMQKIFKQKINFGNDDIWQTKKVSEVATLLNGRAYKKEELLAAGKYRVLRVGNFFTNDSWYYSNLELENDKYANKGDLLYAWSASFGPQIWDDEKIIYHYHIWKVVPNEKMIERDFLYHWFDFDKERILSQKNGTTMVHITKGGLEKTDIQLPSLEQQQRISNFFNKLDERINLNKVYLKALQKQKQGFMQQMFI